MDELDFPPRAPRRSRRSDALYAAGILLATGVAFWVFDRYTYLDRLVKKGGMVRYVQPDAWDRPVPWLLELKGGKFGNDDLRLISTVPTLTKVDVSGSNVDDQGIEIITRLPNLREISVSGTAITDVSMKRLSRLSQLQHVDLSDCPSITAAGVSQIERLPNLLSLRLNGVPISLDQFNGLESRLSGIVVSSPETFVALPEGSPFEVAWAGTPGNRRFSLGIRLGISKPRPVTKEDLRAVPLADRVEILDLSYADLQSGALAELSRFDSVTTLSLHHWARFPGNELPALSRLRSLRELHIRLRPDAVWHKAARLPMLEKLMIIPGVDDSSGPLLISSAVNLQELTVYSQGNFENLLSGLADLPELRVLELDDNQLTDADLHHLTGLTALERLRLVSNRLTAEGLSVLCTLPRLRSLNAYGERLLEGHGIPWLAGE